MKFAIQEIFRFLQSSFTEPLSSSREDGGVEGVGVGVGVGALSSQHAAAAGH